MRRCAFLTMEDPQDFVIDDELVLPHMEALGWSVDQVPWRRPTRWEDYEAVVIRTTWDYTLDVRGFMGVLEQIHQSSATLLNPIELVRWNLRKSYLRQLDAQGVPIPPTIWLSSGELHRIEELWQGLEAEEIVLKPLIGAGARDTYRLSRSQIAGRVEELVRVYGDREAIMQPFLPQVVREGEFSVFFFGRRYSHAILKTPKARDFRVQEEHGGHIQSIEPEPALMDAALRVLEAISPDPLVARVDLVRHQGRFVLMEVELIEPSLYFRTCPQAGPNFARELDAWLDRA